MAEPTFHMDANSLISKWGFGDGDALSDWWWDNYDEDPPFNDHEALYTLALTHLMPLIRAEGWDGELVRIATIHNPVRIEHLNGQDVDWYAPGDNTFSEAHIELTRADIERALATVVITEA